MTFTEQRQAAVAKVKATAGASQGPSTETRVMPLGTDMDDFAERCKAAYPELVYNHAATLNGKLASDGEPIVPFAATRPKALGGGNVTVYYNWRKAEYKAVWTGLAPLEG